MLDVRVRFLHVVERVVARRADGGLEPVAELTVGGEHHVSWEEATERELAAPPLGMRELESSRTTEIDVPAGRSEQELRHADGRPAGALIRSWRRLEGAIEIGARQLARRLWRVRVRISNTAGGSPRARSASRP